MNRIDPGEGGGGGGQAGLKGFLQRKGVGGALEEGDRKFPEMARTVYSER